MGIFDHNLMAKVKTTVEIDEVLDTRFRKAVVQRKGFHKGVLSEAIEEAITKWIEAKNKEG